MDPRRTLIADTALDVIADHGIRGLTHLAVDAAAELPKGSTSYYCRKRVDLLRLAATRLFALDQADLAAVGDELLAASPCSMDQAASAIAGLVARWLSPPDRSRTVARLELFLAIAHDPDLRHINTEQMASAVQLSATISRAMVPAPTGMQVAATLMMVDGLMMTVVRQNLPTPATDDVNRLVRSILGGTATPGAPGVEPGVASVQG